MGKNCKKILAQSYVSAIIPNFLNKNFCSLGESRMGFVDGNPCSVMIKNPYDVRSRYLFSNRHSDVRMKLCFGISLKNIKSCIEKIGIQAINPNWEGIFIKT